MQCQSGILRLTLLTHINAEKSCMVKSSSITVIQPLSRWGFLELIIYVLLRM